MTQATLSRSAASAQIRVMVAGAEDPELRDNLISAVVEGSLYLPASATLEFHDPDLKISARHELIGKPLKIQLGVPSEPGSAGTLSEVFAGEITDVELDLGRDGSIVVSVRAYDRMHRLWRDRHTKVWLNTKDSDIATQICSSAGLRPQVTATSVVHECLIQDNQSDWEFLRWRASRLGYELRVGPGEKLIFGPPAPGAEITVTYLEDLLAFHAWVSASNQVSTVKVRGWDPKNKQAIQGQATSTAGPVLIGLGNNGGSFVQRTFARAELTVNREPVASPAEAGKLAEAVVKEIGTEFVRADGVLYGNPSVQPGSRLKIQELGGSFRGSYTVTEVRHVYESSQYTTEFRVSGKHQTAVLETPVSSGDGRPQIVVLSGIVTNNKDPDNLGRVKVKFPQLSDDLESFWCRVVVPGGGPQRGMMYLPEVNDEVLAVGTDVNHVFVLGGLWNSKDKPPLPATEAVVGGAVVKRVITSRTGHVITLDDSQDKPGISIVDSTGTNYIKIDTKNNNLDVDIAANVTIKAKGKVTIEADQTLELKGKTGAKLISDSGATNVEGKTGASLTTDAQVNVEGRAGATVKTNAQVTVEGTAGATVRSAAQVAVTAPMINVG